MGLSEKRGGRGGGEGGRRGGHLPVHHGMSHAGIDGGEGARCAW